MLILKFNIPQNFPSIAGTYLGIDAQRKTLRVLTMNLVLQDNIVKEKLFQNLLILTRAWNAALRTLGSESAQWSSSVSS